MDHKARAKKLVAQMTLEEKMAHMRYDAPAIPRLGVPAYNWWNECLHGVARAGTATVFPQAIGMAASFNEGLLEEVATAISDEARAKYNEYKTFGDTQIYQGLTMWSPNINLFRDPRWGRGHETYGEDPLLTGRMGVAFIKGLQGDHPVYRKVDATIKHYAVHSGPESSRHYFDAEVSEKDLYDSYLWAFRYCIEHAAPSAVMGAYNRVNGEPCCASKTLLQDILRGHFGFEGYVVSDCGAISDINRNHRVTETEAESAALAVNNGCDLNCGSAFHYLVHAHAQGLITEAVITTAVERLFEARYRLGMFDSDCPYDAISYDVVESPKHIALNRRMAQESMVLLKNDGILPLDPGLSIAVIGPNADDLSVLLANYNGTPSRYTTLLRGIQQAAQGRVRYARGCHPYKPSVHAWEEQPLREAVLAAQNSDVTVLIMGLTPKMEGEGNDSYNGQLGGDKPSLDLETPQQELYEAVIKTGKPVVFVSVSGSCVNLSEQDRQCAAVLQCFYPGAEGGNALADILFGKVSPSGRLPITFYRSDKDLPPIENYAMDNRTYRFFAGEVVYPFGHGLCYGEVTERWLDARCVELCNDGNYDLQYTVLRFEHVPHKELKDFRKASLRAGETKVVCFE